MGEDNSAYGLWSEGEVALEQGDYQTAIDKYKQAADKEPEFENIYSSWFNACVSGKDPDSALSELRKALENNYNATNVYFFLGNSFREVHKYAEAVSHYRQTLNIDPGFTEAYINCGLCHDELEQYDEAIECYRAALEVEPDSVLALNNWGVVLDKRQDYRGAIEKYKQALLIEPDFDLAYLNWSKVIIKLDDPDQEFEAFGRTIMDKYPTATGLKYLGIIQATLQKYPEAVVTYRRLIDLEPEDAAAYICCGLCHDKMEEFDKAIECYRAALEVEPDSPLVWNYWGVALDQLQDYRGAIEKYKEALKVEPDFDLAYSNWSRAIAKLDDPDRELEAFQRAITGDYPTAKGYKYLGDIQYELKNYHDAVEAFTQILKLEPDNADAHTSCGLCHDKQQEYDEAIECYRAAIEADPDSELAWNNWGVALEKLQDYQGAIDKYRQSIAVEPGYDLAYSNWSLAIAKLDDPDPELETFARAITGDYPTAKGYKYLGDLQYELEKYGEAIESYREFIKLEPDNADPYISCGLCYDKLKAFDEAIACYKKVINVKPDLAQVWNNWGVVLDQQQDYQGAIEKYRQALTVDPGYDLAYSNWSRAIAKLPDPDLELEAFRRVITTDYRTAKGYKYLGNTQYDLNKYAEAVESYNELIKREPDNVDAYINRGLCQNKLGLYDEAITNYMEVLKHEPESSLALNNWGVVLDQQQDYQGAIEKYKQALEIKPDDELAYANWSKALPYVDDNALDEFTDKVTREYDTPEGNNILGETLYYEFKRYEEALVYFNRAISYDPSCYNALFNKGNVLRDMSYYDEALETLDAAISVTKNSYSYHNLANILHYLGRFKEAKKKWLDAINAYRRYEKDPEFKPDAWFYIYYGSICHEIFRDNNSAERVFMKAIEVEPDNYIGYLSLAKLYMDIKENTISESEEGNRTRNVKNYKAWEMFHQAVKLVLRNGEDVKNTGKLLELVELYMTFNKPDLAAGHLEKVLEKTPDDTKAITTKGVLLMQEEKYGEALKQFRESLSRKHDDLDVRSKFARCYQKLERHSEAESEYQKILSVSGCHVESLIGLSEVYISEADAAEKKGNSNDAIVYFDKAIHRLQSLLKHHLPFDIDLPDVPAPFLDSPLSRRVTAIEISSIYYSLGYAKTKLSEARKHNDTRLLEEAKNYFSQVEYGTPNYFKAERAGKKVNDLLMSLRRSASGAGPSIVAVFAVIIFLLAQAGFFIGTPVIDYSSYTVNAVVLDTLLADAEVDTGKFSTEINILKNDTFAFEETIQEYLKVILGTESIDRSQVREMVRNQGNLQLKGFEKMGEATYASLTFGSLIFMVAGLFLREITKLKFGAVELEKASTEQVAIGSSLNISK